MEKRKTMNINEKHKEILEWVYCIIIAFVLALFIKYFIGTPTVVQQVSMKPTLQSGQRLILNRLPRTFHKMPERGDIITFEAPSMGSASQQKIDPKAPIAQYLNQPEGLVSKFNYYVLEATKKSYIKRTIALPGEHVELKDGKVYINGVELKEDYLQPNVITNEAEAIYTDFVVPEGCVFAMGDNRGESKDCRVFGCIPQEKIESIVWIRFWPLNTLGTIE